MNRVEALDKAVKIVDEWSKTPTKSNGYPQDGFKAPTLAEKVNAVEQLANFLWEPIDDATAEEEKDATGSEV